MIQNSMMGTSIGSNKRQLASYVNNVKEVSRVIGLMGSNSDVGMRKLDSRRRCVLTRSNVGINTADQLNFRVFHKNWIISKIV